MAQNTDINDIRRQKRRERLIKQLLIALFVVLAIVFIYANRDKWFHKLEGIGSKYEDVLDSDASFPISVSTGVRYEMERCGDSIVVLGNTSFKVYSKNGKLTANFQHAYTTPVLETSSKRILVYDNGGVKFRVDSETDEIYEKTMDENILLARISNEGYAAVVTTSDMYVCMLYVYDDKGKNIYTRGCTNKITDITFKGESEGCYATYVDVSGGVLMTAIDYYDFSQNAQDSDSDYGVSSATLALETVFFENGGYAIVGDTVTVFYDSQNNVEKMYSYDDALTAFLTDESGKVALLFENKDMRCSNLILMQQGETTPITLTLPQSCSAIDYCDGELYTAADGALVSYKFDGTLSKNIGTVDKCSDIVVNGDYIYLLTYDRIERIDSLISSGGQQSEGS